MSDSIVTSAEIDRLITLESQQMLRETIAQYEGIEVLFVAITGPQGIVEQVEACAFGNDDAVPMIEQMARGGSVVIHNHPSGDLRPSQADIEIASRIGNLGIGSYIINNDVTRVRIVVPVMPPREKRTIDLRAIESLLAPEGALSRSMPRYEHRPEQIDMLRTVSDAFNEDGIAVIEAGTGTGKSLAYLLPAIRWAKSNGEIVVISTNTINLQEQLIHKDIPFLQKNLGLDFQAVLMKGRNNYLCRRKADFQKRTPDFFADETTGSQLPSILEWADKTSNGSLSDLPFIPDEDAWEQVAADADNCPRIKCPHYGRCFFYEARRQAARADIVVANHHIVMSDLALRVETGNYSSAAVLPPYKRIIFDEAHNIEQVATQYFGIRITRRVLYRALSRLARADRSSMGLLPFIANFLRMQSFDKSMPGINQMLPLIFDDLIPLRHQLGISIERLMDACAEGVSDFLSEPLLPKREMQLRIVEEVEESRFWRTAFRIEIDNVVEQMERLALNLKKLVGLLGDLPEDARKQIEEPAGEVRSIAAKMSGKVDMFRNFYTIGEDRCRWIEVYRSSPRAQVQVRLISLPLEVQKALQQAVFSPSRTVVCTSATLSVDHRFDFFLRQVGLAGKHSDGDIRDRVVSVQLDTPFDFERQACIGVPTDLPDPGHPDFTEAATNFLLPILQVSKGSAFILFTSYRQMNAFHDRLAPSLQGLGYTCLKQGSENRHLLLRRFKNDRTSILFATSSFWEGVDVPGDSLKLLVLVKLPFGVPTDPLLRARVERLEQFGVDSFSEYIVPQAVIRFKQGFGRLIRAKDDYGAVLVLDRRVVRMGYGQVFLNSLPSQTVHTEDSIELLDRLRGFFMERNS